MKDNSKRLLQVIVICSTLILILLAVLIIGIMKNRVTSSTNNEQNVENIGGNDLNNATANISDENTSDDNNTNEENYIELEPTIYDNLNSVKDVCDYLGCTYINTKKSTEKNFKLDVYINFKYPAVSFVGRMVSSYKSFYEDVIINIADKMDDNFRIIDESNSIIVKVKMSKNAVTGTTNATYLINNNPKFFDDEVSKLSLKNILDEQNKYSNIVVKSEMLQSLIKNNWNAQISIQNMKEQSGKYYVYNGYKVRMLGNSVYNIVFDKDYKGEIFDGITTGMDQEKIYNALGNSFYFGTDIGTPLGYKTRDYYAFFIDGKISIYKREAFNQNKNEQFNALTTQYNQDGNYKGLIESVTKIYTDYIVKESTNDKIDIQFPLEGFEIRFGYKENNGILIFDNFEGKAIENKTLSDIQKENKIPENIHIVYDNLMFEDSLNSME